MSEAGDQQDAAQRLRALRDAGTISDVELEGELRRFGPDLVSGEEASKTSNGGGWVALAIFIPLVAAGLYYLSSVIGAGSPVRVTGDAVGVGEEGSNKTPTPTQARRSIWTVSTGADPMTDQAISTAEARIDAGPFGINVKVACTGSTRIRYQFTVFDQEGNAAPMRPTARVTNNVLRQYGLMEVRVDQAPPEITSEELRYSNLSGFQFDASMIPYFSSPTLAERAAGAQRLTIKLQLANGGPVVVLDQQDSALRSVVDQCVHRFATARAAVASSRKTAAAACRERVAQVKADTQAWLAEEGRTGATCPTGHRPMAIRRSIDMGTCWNIAPRTDREQFVWLQCLKYALKSAV